MIKEAGAEYVIIGHSERRTLFGETDVDVNRKTMAAIAASLTPIVCIGETLEQRERNETMDVLDRQIKGGLDGFSGDQVAALVIAYEPVWAIGTGRTATPAQAGEAHAHIRSRLRQWFGATGRRQCLIVVWRQREARQYPRFDGAARRRRRAGRRRKPRRPRVLRHHRQEPAARRYNRRFNMYYCIVSLYVLVCLVLSLVILLQQGRGGDIASAFGGSSSQAAFGARSGATLLTKATSIAAVLFMLFALTLSIMGAARHGLGRQRHVCASAACCQTSDAGTDNTGAHDTGAGTGAGKIDGRPPTRTATRKWRNWQTHLLGRPNT